MNIIAITGTICKDLELRYTGNNKPVLENTLAVRKGIKNKETGKYDCDFIDFVCFEKKAEYLDEYAKKGDKIEVVGKLRVDNWKDDKDNYHKRVYIVADSINILSSKPKEEKNPYEDFGNSIKTDFDKTEQIKITSDDLPF